MTRVALVTGASRGIGKAVASTLHKAGFAVAVNYSRSAESAEEVADAIQSDGGRALAICADVGIEDQVADMFAAVRDELGPVAVLVNNAGITRDNLLLRMSLDSWNEVMTTNLQSVFLCSKEALKDMVRARWGRIVSISSVAGITGNAGQANYAASKGAVIAVTKSLAKEVGSRGITVNAIAPGWIETDMTSPLGEEVTSRAMDAISLRRLGQPEEIASAVGYLASDEAGYITGQTIVIDGGLAF